MSAAWLQPLNLPGDIHDNSLTFEYHVRKKRHPLSAQSADG
jgi:hypothetical protein